MHINRYKWPESVMTTTQHHFSIFVMFVPFTSDLTYLPKLQKFHKTSYRHTKQQCCSYFGISAEIQLITILLLHHRK